MTFNQENLDIILNGCRRGKRAAQKALYHHFYSYALTVALHYSKNREEAEEIVQAPAAEQQGSASRLVCHAETALLKALSEVK